MSGAPILSGWTDFDAMAPLAPGRVTLLAGPDDAALSLARALVAGAAAAGRAVRVVEEGKPVGPDGDVGLLVALEPGPRMVARLRRHAARLGAPALLVRQGDGEEEGADEVVRVRRAGAGVDLAFPRRGARFLASSDQCFLACA